MASRHITPSAVGSSVTTHVQDHMQERVRQEADQHLPHAVDQTVSQHLGDFTADDHDPRQTVKPVVRSRADIPDPTGLIAQLHQPAGMRKAIVLQEILSRPRALRK